MYVRHKTVAATVDVGEEVDVMVDIMKEAFRSNLDSLAWMSQKSKMRAGDKLDKMMDLIGYPEQVSNNYRLDISPIPYSDGGHSVQQRRKPD